MRNFVSSNFSLQHLCFRQLKMVPSASQQNVLPLILMQSELVQLGFYGVLMFSPSPQIPFAFTIFVAVIIRLKTFLNFNNNFWYCPLFPCSQKCGSCYSPVKILLHRLCFLYTKQVVNSCFLFQFTM